MKNFCTLASKSILNMLCPRVYKIRNVYGRLESPSATCGTSRKKQCDFEGATCFALRLHSHWTALRALWAAERSKCTKENVRLAPTSWNSCAIAMDGLHRGSGWFKWNPSLVNTVPIADKPGPPKYYNLIIKLQPRRLIHDNNYSDNFILHPIAVRCKLRSSNHEGESLVACAGLPLTVNGKRLKQRKTSAKGSFLFFLSHVFKWKRSSSLNSRLGYYSGSVCKWLKLQTSEKKKHIFAQMLSRQHTLI